MKPQPLPGGKPPRIVIVAHGSRSREWVAALRAWHRGVVEQMGDAGGAVELAFLEIAEPQLEDRLGDLAKQGGPVVVVPFFLSRSGHAGDDVPRIAEEKLGGHVPWRIVSPQGWETVLGRNAARRLLAAGARTGDPVIVSGYGASHHDELWRELIREVQDAAGPFAGGAPWLWAPSGHFLADYGAPLRTCLASVERGARRITTRHAAMRRGSGATFVAPDFSPGFTGPGGFRRPQGSNSRAPVGPLPGSGSLSSRVPGLKSGATNVASLPGRTRLASPRGRGKPRAAILPLYLSVSTYQKELIPAAISEFPGLRISFQPDAILPDAELESWMAQLLLRELLPEPRRIGQGAP